MSDGPRLRQSWSSSLNDAEAHFRQLLTSSSSEWKRIINAGDSSPSKKGKTRVAANPELTDVVVHRNLSKAGNDVYRLVLDVPTGDDVVSLEPWKAVLSTPELRQEWDPAVEEAHLLEMFDHTTRISKTKFSLGWPANPRDAVAISRLIHDPSTVIDITTSLPRSPDEPAYLRPSPPFVRSHVSLLAWCIQHIPPQLSSSAGQPAKRKSSLGGRLRITCFWQHDLKALFTLGSSSGLTQQLSTMTLGLLKTVKKRASRIPKLAGYGHGVSLGRIRFEIDREALTVEYSIIPEDNEHMTPNENVHGMDEVHALREQRRLTRSIECVLPSTEGWDVQITTKASSEDVEQLPWSALAVRNSSTPSSSQYSSTPDQIVLRLTHAALIDDHSVLKVRVVIEVSGPSSGLRLNGLPQTIQDVEDRDPSSYFITEQILQDVSSVDLSLHTSSSMGTVNSTASSSPTVQTVVRPAERSAAADKSVLSRVRRNYIYFSSLLQEPEAKWRRTTDARGVSITQLDSIDPTLVVYRAEATFVGVGLWDLYAAIVSPGAKSYWDKQHEDAVLLEDVNELTELWRYKTKPAWPVNGRDSVLLKTVYKSPTTIHVFSFSADDPHLFPNIPPVEPTVIRTQVDLQGWAIEALSPTTTLLTLLEQSDPKGWANKTTIPTQMINSLAGIGEFVIKCGGPPVITRLAGAKMIGLRYDHERSSFRIEYEASASRRTSNASSDDSDISTSPVIECEIRCDMDTWAYSLDIVVDPPPQTISCLRRHRLSTEGGGLWISLAHDAMFVDDDRLLTIVRRAPGKEKGLVMVNGAKVAVDVEELPEHEIKLLAKQKRVKPPRIPLDQPPVMGVIRRRRAEWDADSVASSSDVPIQTTTTGAWASAPKISSPLVRFFSYAVDQATVTTQQAVAAMSPATAAVGMVVPSPLKLPMQYALDALAWTQETHTAFPSAGWELVNEKGLPIHKKLAPEISPVIPVYKGLKVVEGVSAEELASVIVEANWRKKWDDRYDSVHVLESFGGESRTAFSTCKAGFPWRDRGFYVASVMARAHMPLSRRNTESGEVAERSNGVKNAIFYVSASFSPDSVAMFSSAKYNPYSLPIGRVYVDAWILETLDPYTKENYAIPSTRCTRLVAMDFAGTIPAAVNSMINATLPRSILAVESCIKGSSSLPITRLPTPGLVITDKKMDEHHLATSGWKLRKRDESRVLTNTKYASETRVYISTILVTLPPHLAPPPAPLSPDDGPSTGAEQMTPRVGRRVLGSSPPTELLFKDLPQSSSAPGSLGNDPHSRSSSPSHSPPLSVPSLRQRTASSTSISALDDVPDTSLRSRASSSAFTLKGEVRPSTDLLVAELVVDSKLYPDGYDIMLRSRMRSRYKIRHAGREHCVPLNWASTSSLIEESGDNVLPFTYTIYTVPSSPLHSSGLNEGQSPTRHLLKLSLPTAQYQVSTVRDPLTGEMHSAPPRPSWLTEMQEGGAVVEVEVRPLVSGEGKGRQGGVRVDGKEVEVVGEKESLTNLGREELLDDRVSKMGVLSRVPTDAEPLPEEFRVSVAIADDLLDPVVVSSATANLSEQTMENGSISEVNEDTSHLPGSQHDLTSTSSSPVPTPDVPHVVSTGGSGGFLGFLQAYSNPMTRFTMPNLTATAAVDATTSEISTSTEGAESSPRASTASSKLPGGLGDIDATATFFNGNKVAQRLYPMSTVLVAALIAFLIGSLLRSLLSPADFIYVVTDLRDAEEANNVGGWREIRRLLEVKYLVGGWDFQIAVVRRH